MSALNVLLGGDWVLHSLEQTKRVDEDHFQVPASAISSGVLAPSLPPGDKFDLKGISKTATHALQQVDSSFLLDLRTIDGWQERTPPYKNEFASKNHFVEVLQTKRPISISYKGQQVAKSTNWFILFEGSLGSNAKNYPLRYYIPMKDVKKELLSDSSTSSHCPYKGDARYWKLDGDDLVWGYDKPATRAVKDLADCVCFYLEKEGFDYTIEGGDIPYPASFQFAV